MKWPNFLRTLVPIATAVLLIAGLGTLVQAILQARSLAGVTHLSRTLTFVEAHRVPAFFWACAALLAFFAVFGRPLARHLERGYTLKPSRGLTITAGLLACGFSIVILWRTGAGARLLTRLRSGHLSLPHLSLPRPSLPHLTPAALPLAHTPPPLRVLVYGAVLLAVALLFAIVQRFRAQRLFRQVRTLARSANPDRARLQRVARDTAESVVVENLAALQLERNTRALIPLPGYSVNENLPAKPITDLLDTLERYSVLTAGMEQILLNVAAMPAPVMQVTELWYAGMVPQHLQGAAANVLHYIGHQFTPNMLAVAKDVAAGAAHQLSTQEAVVKIGLEGVHGLVDGGALHAGESMLQAVAQNVVTRELGETFLHSVGQHVGGAQDIVSATQHLETLAHSVGHAANAMDFLGGAHGHLPVITMFVSAWREIRLLDDGKTTSERALGNWTTDVASAGTGAVVGGIFGQILVPIPGVGALLGAAAGGMIGRLFGNKFKARYYEEALRQHSAAYETMRQQLQQVGKNAIAQVRTQGEIAQKTYLAQIGTAPRLATTITSQLVPVVARLHSNVAASLRHTSRTVSAAEHYVGAGFVFRAAHLFVPVPADLSASVKTLRSRVNQSQRLLPASTSVRSDPLAGLSNLARVAETLPLGERDQRRQFLRWERSQARIQALLVAYRKQMLAWERRAAQAYNRVGSAYIPKVLAQLQVYGKEKERLMQPVHAAAAQVEMEQQRLGR